MDTVIMNMVITNAVYTEAIQCSTFIMKGIILCSTQAQAMMILVLVVRPLSTCGNQVLGCFVQDI